MSPGTQQSWEKRDLVCDWSLLPGQALRSPELWKPCLFPSAHPNQPAMEVISQDRERRESKMTDGKSNKQNKGGGKAIRREKQGKMSKTFYNCLFSPFPEVTQTSGHFFNIYALPAFGNRAASPRCLFCRPSACWSRAPATLPRGVGARNPAVVDPVF